MAHISQHQHQHQDLYSAMVAAARENNIEYAKFLMEGIGYNLKFTEQFALTAVGFQSLDLLKYLATHSSQFLQKEDTALCQAVEFNNLEVIDFLWSLYDGEKDRIVRRAINKQNTPVIDFLATRVSPKILNESLCFAAEIGFFHGVKVLIGHGADPRKNESGALRVAAECGFFEVAQYLTPLSKPKACQSEALFWACLYNGRDLFELLYPVSSPEKTLVRLYDNYSLASLHVNEDQLEKGRVMLRERMAFDQKRLLLGKTMKVALKSPQKNKRRARKL